MLKLISVKELNGEIKALLNRKLEVTLSLAYYSMIHGNSAPLKGFDKDITSQLDSKTKQFICAVFKNDEWQYNKEKASKLLKKLNLTFQDCEWDAFCEAINKDLETPKEELTQEEQRVKDIKSGKSSVQKAVSKLLGAGCSIEQVQAILQDAVLMETAGKIQSAA